MVNRNTIHVKRAIKGQFFYCCLDRLDYKVYGEITAAGYSDAREQLAKKYKKVQNVICK